jgi:vacuolar-type H+-ATPase subunit E/Vma4
MPDQSTQNPVAEGLRKAMAERAESERKKRIEAARAEADSILAEAKEAAEAEAAEIAASAQQQLAAQQRLWREQDESDALRIRQTARHGLANEVLEGIERRLAEIARSHDFPDVLVQLAEEAMALAKEQTAEGTFLVKCPPAHVEALQKQLGGDVTMEGDAGLTDGVSVQDASCSFRVRNTLSARFAKLEPEIRRRAAQDLASLTEDS